MSIIRKEKRKRTRGKIIALVIVIILLIGGIGAGILHILQLYTKQEARSLEKEKIQQYGMIVTTDLKQGEIINEGQIKQIVLTKEQQELNYASYEAVIGKRLRYEIPANTMLIPEMIEEGELANADTRKHCYHFIEMTDVLCVGDYVDIRIQFPNGADFIILSKKKVLCCSRYDEQTGTQNDLWLEVSEEEILLLSSAVVDAAFQEQATIYAIQYISQDQEKAIITYPENEVVHALINEDPNIIPQAIEKMEKRVRERVMMRLPEYGQQELEYEMDKEQVVGEGETGQEPEEQEENSLLENGDAATLDQLQINYVD